MKLTNPAALSAFARGDLENALVASTPGGIEAQEAAGQAMLCASEQLPKEINGATREQLEAIGFKFGADVDELFVTARLPPGWTKVATGHSMHSEIVDANGKIRASIFYKAAFYDRRADMRMSRRFSFSSFEDHPTDDKKYTTQITDSGKPVHQIGESERGAYEARKELDALAKAWLTEKYPEWQSVFAYWE